MNLQAQAKLDTLNPEQLNELYKKVFNSDAGALILEDLKNRCFSYDSSFSHSDIKGLIEFNEGKRSVILHIETQLLPNVENKETQ